MSYRGTKSWEVWRRRAYMVLFVLFLIALIYLLAIKANLLVDFWTN